MPPRLARLLAAVVAIALVAGAFAVRGAIAGDDDDGDASDDRTSTSGPRPDDDGDATGFRLACDEDLGPVCDALGVEPISAGRMLAAAETDELPWDAWLTLDRMGGVLDSTRIDAGLDPVTTDPMVVASSSLALLALEDPPGGCDDDPSVAWTCLIEPPEPFRSGIAVPSRDTALGIFARAAAATGVHGGTDFDRFDFRGTPEADAVIAFLDDSPSQAGPTTARQTDAMFRPGTADGAITTGDLAQRRADTIQGADRGLRALPLEPTVTVGVALVGLGAEGEAAVRALQPRLSGQTVADELARAGWAGDAAPTSGLPGPEFIFGVREELGR